MEYVGLAIFYFACLQFFVAFVNLIFSSKIPKSVHTSNDLVSVAIPVRNEEANIEKTLQSIINQDYKNIEILIYNDFSTDNTQQIIEKYEQIDSRIRLITPVTLPNDWLGKNFACYNLAQHAQGKYILFLDADVTIYHSIIEQTIAYAHRYHLGLISIFPKQLLLSRGEKLVVPFMNFILLTLLPLILVRKSSFVSLSAANGQFMFFLNSVYQTMQPHAYVKNNKVEDIAIARYFKKNRIRISCNTGDNTVSCRMYSSYNEAIYGFSKNAKTFFGNSLLLAFLFVLVQLFGWIVVLWMLPISYFFFYVFMQIFTKIFVLHISKHSIIENLLFSYFHIISLGVSLLQGIKFSLKKNYKWKGRNII